MDGFAATAERTRCLAAGMDACLTEPMSLDALASALKRRAGVGQLRSR